jgi:hypothetical protein
MIAGIIKVEDFAISAVSTLKAMFGRVGGMTQRLERVNCIDAYSRSPIELRVFRDGLVSYVF